MTGEKGPRHGRLENGMDRLEDVEALNAKLKGPRFVPDPGGDNRPEGTSGAQDAEAKPKPPR